MSTSDIVNVEGMCGVCSVADHVSDLELAVAARQLALALAGFLAGNHDPVRARRTAWAMQRMKSSSAEEIVSAVVMVGWRANRGQRGRKKVSGSGIESVARQAVMDAVAVAQSNLLARQEETRRTASAKPNPTTSLEAPSSPHPTTSHV